jgi:arsenite methyltransferase
MSQTSHVLNVEDSVRKRYSSGASVRQENLCCPTSYDPRYLAAIPQEVLERDYGCGDPSRHLREGEIVLDLGCGTGQICFIASQIVGPKGSVIGIDMNNEMLGLARRSAPIVAKRLGYANVEFRKAKIQDLTLDLERVELWLNEHPVRNGAELEQLEAFTAKLRNARPLIEDNSVDVVVSNCVLNLVRSEDKRKLFSEIYRVLRRGGRAVISDITSDEAVPAHLQNDLELWSGCISGALREDEFLKGFEEAGFYGLQILERQQQPWRIVEGIEFRSMSVVAYKGKEGRCWDHKQAVIYKGPFKQVVDDDGHVLNRGTRIAVCEKTFNIYSKEPYRSQFEFVEPLVKPSPEEVRPFPCARDTLLRHPREGKGEDYRLTTEAKNPACDPDEGCC